MTDIGNFEEFTDGCNCGDPLGHHPDCIVGQAKFNGRPTALPSDETLSYRRSILQGADPDSGEPLGRPGWIDAVEEAETAALRQTWFAGLGALHDVYVRFQGSFTGAYAQIGWKDSRCRAADRTQWNKTLLATVRQQEALSGADLAQIRAGAIARLLTTRWETRGHMHPRRLVTDVVRIDDSSLVLRLRPHAADMTYESLAFRRWIACWLHFAWVASPNRRDALAAAAMPDVLVAAQAHPGEPMERPPTRFVRLRHSAMLNIGTDHAAAELSAGTAAFLEGNVVHWPVGRMVAGSWPPLCVERARRRALHRSRSANPSASLAQRHASPWRRCCHRGHLGFDAWTKPLQTPAMAGGRRLSHNPLARESQLGNGRRPSWRPSPPIPMCVSGVATS